MKLLDLTLPTPEENLACDEALLYHCEAGRGDEILRFWEPNRHFVVVGYSNRVAAEVNEAACQAAGVPILRRCSGGGTVLQGPGCLNYSLLLRITEGGPLETITSANRFIMDRNRQALEAALGQPVQVRGHTDLALGERKCSGNAQRRKRHFLLFHGCFLVGLDPDLVERCLRLPSREPDYRGHRSHEDFLVNLGVSSDVLKDSLGSAWAAVPEARAAQGSGSRNAGLRSRDEHLLAREHLSELVREKYGTREWTFKFP